MGGEKRGPEMHLYSQARHPCFIDGEGLLLMICRTYNPLVGEDFGLISAFLWALAYVMTSEFTRVIVMKNQLSFLEFEVNVFTAMAHFTVTGWNQAGVDLVLIQSFLLYYYLNHMNLGYGLALQFCVAQVDRAPARCLGAHSSNPVGNSDFSFVPRSWHADHFIFT